MELVIGGVVVLVVLVVVFALVARQSSGDVDMSSPGRRPAVAGGTTTTSMTRKLNWLEGTGGSVLGKTYHVGTRDITIGRKVGNYIQLTDDKVSRVHAKIKGTASGIEVTDNDTQSGTKVNGTALVSGVPQKMEDGDTLEIGGVVFTFRARGEFATNHGLTDQKTASEAANKQTAVLGIVDWKAEVSNALLEAGGDRAKAAEIMGVSQEIFEKMLQQAQEQGD
jgi:pSer/pThr/pTyr-binding forkhead associated (FHA) protein